ncbi:MAG TPA: ESPR-type extended signal peptide-containing protein, partial [Stenotrophomonas sp.]
MNRIYRKVWNKSLGMWTVASELATSDSPGVMVDRRAITSQRTVLTAALLLSCVAWPAWSQSVEVGGNQNCIVLGGSILDSCVVDGSANASGTNAVAIGTSTVASGANSVAVGAGARATEANTFSVGSGGVGSGPATRRVVNVSDGVSATDAVNKGQLDAVSEVAETTSKYFQASGSDDSDAGAYVEGDNAVAAGEASNAIGDGASAFGSGANALATNATAVGFNALASEASASAFGDNAQALGVSS